MKKLFILNLIFLFPFIVYSQNEALFAEVDSNYVTLWQTNTQRICGSYYEMDVSIDNLQVEWLQKNVGMAATCWCIYDLSVTIGPFSDGQYEAGVYSIELMSPDTIFHGTIQFEIETSPSSDSVAMVNQYSGPCQMVVVEEEKELRFQVQKNPSSSCVKILFSEIIKQANINIFNQTGKLIYKEDISGTSETQINVSDLSAGMYFVIIFSDSETAVSKFVKY